MFLRNWIGSLGVTLVVACGAVGEDGEQAAAAEGQNGNAGGAAQTQGADVEGPRAGGAESGQTGDADTTPSSQAPAPPSTFKCERGRTGVAGDRTLTLTVSGQERTALVHVPKTYDPLKGTSVVLAFHGYGGTAAGMKTQAGLDAESEKRGFIVVHVEGTGLLRGFNGGDCCGQPAWTANTDDTGVARAIDKALVADYCVDPKRVYSAGFSNGGFMSYRLACEAADVFAAVASVSGVLGIPAETCKPSRPVPIMHVHGTADTTVPFKGGAAVFGLGALVNVDFRSVDETVSTFRKRWTCGEASKLVSEKGDTRCEEWTGCQDGARVELCTVTGGGHKWPGGPVGGVGGKTSTDFDASARILDFFAAHPMP